jgi:uncharacterized protein (DUF1919 family)
LAGGMPFSMEENGVARFFHACARKKGKRREERMEGCKERVKRLLGERMLAPWWRFRKGAERCVRALRRSRLRTRTFTVISNNCFGGFVYQRYGLAYQTPTAGLFFMPDEYLRLLADPRAYFSAPLRFIDPDAAPHARALRALDARYGTYPVARLRDVTVYFMHYATEKEAREKWERRTGRICWPRVLYKFCDQNGATPEQIAAFDALPYAHKVCFCARPYPGLESVVFLRRDAGQPCVRAQTEENGFDRDYRLTRAINRLSRP